MAATDTEVSPLCHIVVTAIRRGLVSVAAGAALCLLSPAAGLAAPPALSGPGTCPFHPGQMISPAVNYSSGPNAGPNTQRTWMVDPGTPATPGQAIQRICMGG